MVLGIGIDHVRAERIRSLLARYPDRAGPRLFTETERRACDGRVDPADCYAARFAAKEAFVKALGTGLTGGMRWTDIEIRRRTGGRPGIILHDAARRTFEDLGGGRIHLSFTHEGGTAVAVVVLERSDETT
jgi:holo-[acyl-carrier protein] synthase